MTPYPGGVYRSRSSRPASVFTLPFIVLVGAIFAMVGAGYAFLLMIPIVPIAAGGAIIGLGVGLLCRALDKGGYS